MGTRRGSSQRTKPDLDIGDGLFKAVTKSLRPRKSLLPRGQDDSVDFPYASISVSKCGSRPSMQANSRRSSQKVSPRSSLLNIRSIILISVLLTALAYGAHSSKQRQIEQCKYHTIQAYEEWAPHVERFLTETIPRYLRLYYQDILPSPTIITSEHQDSYDNDDEDEAEDWNPAATSTALPHDEIHAILSTAKQARTHLDEQLSRIRSSVKAHWSDQLSGLRAIGESIFSEMEKLKIHAEQQVRLRAKQAYMAVIDDTEHAVIRQAENAALNEVRRAESFIYAIRLEVERRIDQLKRRQQSKG